LRDLSGVRVKNLRKFPINVCHAALFLKNGPALPNLAGVRNARIHIYRQPDIILPGIKMQIETETMNYCNYCPGYCCYRLNGSVLLIDNDDINRLARHFAISDGEIRKRYMENRYTFRVKDDGSCIFQAAGRMIKRCTIHAVRPAQCRNFPYDNICPYLEREDLLSVIQPRVAKSLKNNWLKVPLPENH
jgi:Fe-S-cluster containining protein